MKAVHFLYLICVLLIAPVTASAERLAGSDIRLDTATGAVSLKDLQGKVVYLDFWASWCGPCRKSFPWMNAMHDKYKDAGLVVIAVNEDNDRKEAETFLKKIPASFLIAYDTNVKLAESVRLEAMPSSFLLAKDGTVIKKHLGFKTGKTDEYEAAIRAALGLTPLN
jgi:thiol-disulfide isomerase/thioredoxin